MVPWAMQLIITGFDWRTAWFTLGILTLALGVVPSLLLVARRPEDMGLEPDPAPSREDSLNRGSGSRDAEASSGSGNAGGFAETNFTVGQALRERGPSGSWRSFPASSMMVQAGVSLHQVSHYINQGIDPALRRHQRERLRPGPNAGDRLLGRPGAADAHPIPDDGQRPLS